VLRFPSAVFGTLAVALLLVLAMRLLPTGAEDESQNQGGQGSLAAAAGVLAALLGAVHPLLVYYGQEARMYTLLLLLVMLAAYLLLRAAEEPRRWIWWGGFVLVAAAAMYTHYFALFALLALGLAHLLDDWASGRAAWSRTLRLAGAYFAVGVLYLPWVTNLTTRLRIDRSYWAGTLKLDEALLDVAQRFTSGETMGESTALWLLLAYAFVTVPAVIGLRRAWPLTRRLVTYALPWLLLPVAAVLLLAAFVPKFNPRYVMLSLPGLLLLWAGGLAALAWGAKAAPEDSGTRVGRRALAGVGVVLLLVGAGWSNLNWFTNPVFDKDHWRQITEFLRTRVREDELIVLVSGHAWPVWEYYAADVPVVRLPQLEILDVDAVLDFANSGPPLIEAFAEEQGKRGAWLVSWQEEVVDPNDVAPVQLELGGREKGQTATFSGLGLRRFGGIRDSRIATAPPIDKPLDVRFGDAVTLLGYRVLNNGDLLLFWRREGEAAGDLHMAIETQRAGGSPLAQPQDRRLAGYTYPSFRWPDGEVVMGNIPAAQWLGDAAAEWLAAAEAASEDEADGSTEQESPAAGTVQFALKVYDGEDPAAAPLLPQVEAAAGASIGASVTDDGALRINPVEVVID
jgi:hypothetical protein